MDKQPMAMHNTFWRDDQVCILFLSNQPLLNMEGMLNIGDLKRVIMEQPFHVTNFLQQQIGETPDGAPIMASLSIIGDDSEMDNTPPDMQPGTTDKMSSQDDTEILPGIYAFNVALPQIDFNLPFQTVQSSFATFFQIEDLSPQAGGMTSMGMSVAGEPPLTSDLMLRIVKKINTFLEILNKQTGPDIVAAVASPTWLTGGTQNSPITQGCPLTPPMPVEHDSCSDWHIQLPNLSPDIQPMTGKGVSVFILDAIPELGVIARAARDAGDDNHLLRNVEETVRFNYSVLSGVQAVEVMRATHNAFDGKDVYGQHYPILMPDHGLFIAGMVRDVAPKASIECIRVLDDLCVGDANLITNALSIIYSRKIGTAPDSLEGKPVVINMSLVIPTDDELASKGLDLKGGAFHDIRATIYLFIKALTDLGVIIVASAGNEGDQREMTGYRPDALYPAAFCYQPYNNDKIIPVGAVDSAGNVTGYSCFPGPRGVATFGGGVPNVPPPPASHPAINPSDLPGMVRGIYSSVEYPPLSAMPPEQYYAASNDHAWAYWVGTSFATPIVSALAARVLQANPGGDVHQTILNEAGATVQWDNLDPGVAGHGTGQQPGNMLLATQKCKHRDRDEEDELEVMVELTEISVIEE